MTGVNGVSRRAILSARHGGRATEVRNKKTIPLKSYCLFYYQRPPKIHNVILCVGLRDEITGRKLFDKCPDFGICLRNRPKSGKPKEPYDPPVVTEKSEG